MSPEDRGGPAFPIHPSLPDRLGCTSSESDAGMTLRDYFAAHAITAFMAAACTQNFKPKNGDVINEQVIAESAYALADAMLKERVK